MCLAVPAQLIECEKDEAVADLHGNQVRISTQLVPEAKIGDWVLIHAGFAIQLLDEEALRETWEIMGEVEKAMGGGNRDQGSGARAKEAPDVHPGLGGEGASGAVRSAGGDTGGTVGDSES